MNHTHAKGQGQRPLGSEFRVETDGGTDRQTEAIALPPLLTRSVKTTTHAPLISCRCGFAMLYATKAQKSTTNRTDGV